VKWQRWPILSFLPLFVFLFWITLEKGENVTAVKREPSSAGLSSKKERREVYRQLVKDRKVQDQNLRNRIPQSVSRELKKDSTVAVTRGHELLMDVGAVPRSEYSPKMGELLQEQDGVVYFRTEPGHDYLPVARSKMSDKLYPVSNIVHIKKVTPELREKIRAEGYIEHFYHSHLGFLSIKTSPGEVLKVYSELKEMGLKVQLEVIGPRHQAI
jgi:hypothetical protein